MNTASSQANDSFSNDQKNIHTGGGSSIEGDVATGGNFIGRDHVQGETVYHIEAGQVIINNSSQQTSQDRMLYMFEPLMSILSVIFEPLLGLPSGLFGKSSKPRRKMVKQLLELYESFDDVDFLSQTLVREVEECAARNWAAWTVTRSKRVHIVETSEKLKNSVNELGVSLRQLYRMLEIKEPLLLAQLVVFYDFKEQILNGHFDIVLPHALYNPEASKYGELSILIPPEDIPKSDPLMRGQFYRNREKIKVNYLAAISIEDKTQIDQLVEQAHITLTVLSRLKSSLREFIKVHISIDDFFQ